MEHIFEIIENNEYEIIAEGPDGQGIGYAMACLVGSDTLDLRSIIVYPGWRDSGLGTTIMQKMFSWAQEQGARVLTGSFFPDPGMDEQLRAFYERLGIKVTPDLKLYKDFLRR